jgi:hypothetical protein
MCSSGKNDGGKLIQDEVAQMLGSGWKMMDVIKLPQNGFHGRITQNEEPVKIWGKMFKG